MANILPPDSEMLCLMCEGVREEGGGKTTLLGYFGGNTVMVPANTQFPAMINFGMLFGFSKGEGTFPCALKIFAPDPKMPPIEGVLPDVVKNAGRNHNIIVNASPFPLVGFGTYRVELILGGQPYHRELIVMPS